MKQIGMAVIGAGTWGQAHAEVYSTYPYSKLVAICDLNEERACSTAQKYNVDSYTNYKEMLARDDIDAVGIVTPDFAHAEPVIAAAEAGKHILCEKPLATTREDAENIVKAVTANNVKLMIDYHNRWNPPVFKIKEDIMEGKLGKIISAYVRLNNIIYVPTEMLSWAAKSSIMWFLGSHSIDVLCWLIDSRVRRVFSVSQSEVLVKLGIDVPDVYQTILEFENGAIATTENSWILPNTNPYVNDYKLNITGEKGMFNMDFSHNSLLERFLPDKADHPDVLCKPIVQGKAVGLGYESIRDFIDRIYRNEPLVISLEESLRVTEVILAIFESAQKREPVEVEYMTMQS